MPSINQTLQIISIQHELAMSIGLDLNLDKMLNIFMQRLQKRLSLRCVNVVFVEPHSNTALAESGSAGSSVDNTSQAIDCFSFPRAYCTDKKWVIKQANTLFNSLENNYQQLEYNNTHFYFFIIPSFAVMVLERQHKTIDIPILNALTPLFSRLATSCQACVEHTSLKQEISARAHTEGLLIQQALHDSLTQLPNRKMLGMSLEKAMNNVRQNDSFGGVFVIDLDRFKVVNDSLGHSLGDEVLKIIAQRFATYFDCELAGNGNILAKVGGDEFVLLVSHLANERINAIQKASDIAQALAAQLVEPIKIAGNELSLSVSIGSNLFPLENEQIVPFTPDNEVLMKNADLAMYSVKNTNRNGYALFNEKLMAFSQQRTKIENHLKLALQNQEFSLHYQPLISKDNTLTGAEALLRWHNIELGFVSPAEFIPIAEECGLILEIGDWVIRSACELISVLEKKALSKMPKYISVNVSPRQFAQQNFVERVLAIVNEAGISPKHLRIEITESVAIGKIELAIEKMQKLQRHGIMFMLDDFGSGYSSLSYLHKLPLRTIKIDRSFIKNINLSSDNQVITGSILDICEHFSLECIVEGVENIEEYEYLMNRPLTAFQGYYFYKPMPTNDFIKLLG